MTVKKHGVKVRITKKVLWRMIEGLKQDIGTSDRLGSAAEEIDNLRNDNRKLRQAFKSFLQYLNIEWLKNEYGGDVFQPKKKEKKLIN